LIDYQSTTNLLLSVKVKEVWKSVKNNNREIPPWVWRLPCLEDTVDTYSSMRCDPPTNYNTTPQHYRSFPNKVRITGVMLTSRQLNITG